MTEYKQYVVGLEGPHEVQSWVETTLTRYLKKAKPAPSQTEVEHVLDYLCSSQGPPKLRRMSYPQALKKADAWSKAQQKKGRNLIDDDDDLELIHDFLDGTRIVKLLTKKAYQREGHLMSHCLGGYEPTATTAVYSYRDSKNYPHATFEVRVSGDDESVEQIKGKGNGPIHPKYIHPILTFLESIGTQIRPHDMRNLGYYHVSKDLVPLIAKLNGVSEQLVVLKGEQYAVG